MRMQKLLAVGLVSVLVLLLIVQVTAVYSPERCDGNTESVVFLLQQLCGNFSVLPDEAFAKVKLADVKRNVLCNKVNAVIYQVEAGAYEGALNKLRNDVEKAVAGWIVSPWKERLISFIEYIIQRIKCIPPADSTPPVIQRVFRCPDVPEYDDNVLVMAYVTDSESGVANVTLSYSVNSGESVNLTMNEIDGLFEAVISPEPYNTSVVYFVYAWDNAGNVAVSEANSYIVSDFHSPVISYIERVPDSPNYNETVSVFINATEPSSASGVKEYPILAYYNGSVWMNVTMSFQEGIYIGVIPELPYGTVVKYRVYVFDNAGNWFVTDVYSYTVNDQFLPIVRIDAPVRGSYVAGCVNVSVYAYDDYFSKAELMVNKTILDSWSDVGSHAYVWNTSVLPDGVYMLKLKAYDNVGNIGVAECSVTVDNTAPMIGVPYQNPNQTTVEPYQNVTVSVEVTDGGGAGVREVILFYSVDEGQTWTNVSMDKTIGNFYVGVIKGFELGIRVQYGIMAYDYVNNLAVENNAGEYYVYTVIPEFSEFMILFFMVATLIAAALVKREKR